MALKLYEEQSVSKIAESIRALNNSTDTYTVDEMSDKISNYWGDFSPIQNSTEDNGQPFNGGLGYQTGHRISSGGLKVEEVGSCCTGWFSVETGDTLRIKFSVADTTSIWYINLYNANREQISLFSLASQSVAVDAFSVLVKIANVKYCRFSIADTVDVETRMKATKVKVIHNS